jgi:polyferredoxin
MPAQPALNPLMLVKFALWIAVIVAATLLLRRRKVRTQVRLAFVIGGLLLFGIVFGLLIPSGDNPNPVTSLRTLLTALLVRRKLVLPVVVALVLLLAMVWLSNKSICGWGCQLGLFQDLLHRAPLPKWSPPFWLANGVRIAAFAALAIGLAVAGMDWIGWIDPFALFSFDLSLGVALFGGALAIASLFVYRPWCQFLCPFGLIGWLLEQKSVFRVRIDRQTCRDCQACVRACPGQAMSTIYQDKRFRADCYACGACLTACPQEDALSWRARPVREESRVS